MNLKNHIRKIALIAFIAISWVFVSCESAFHENLPECRLYVKFKYDYNTKSVDAFASQVDKVDLYVFDKDSVLIKIQPMTSDELEAGIMEVKLPVGEYLFMAWAGLHESSYEVPKIAKSDTITKMDVRLSRDTMTKTGTRCAIGKKIDPLWYGEMLPVTFTGEVHQTEVVNLIKNSNTINFLFYSADGTTELKKEDYRFELVEANGRMCYKNDLLLDDTLSYQPYLTRQETNAGMSAELNTLRLLEGRDIRFIVTDLNTNAAVFDINLGEFLSLMNMSTNTWTTQEYLDREDEYTVVFFLSGSWQAVKISINKWTVYEQKEGL